MDENTFMGEDWTGEYWNVDVDSPNITRFRFEQRDDIAYVSAWGACFPLDCPWGETTLHLLADDAERDGRQYAFATWEDDVSPTHCLFTLDKDELRVTSIAIRHDMRSYKRVGVFKRDAVRTAEAQNPDPMRKFRHLWDGSQPGWQLVRFEHPVYLVEFNFAETGPTESEFTALREYVSSRPNETIAQMRERLRDCSGVGLGKPLGPQRMSRLRELKVQYNLDLTVREIEPGEHLMLDPEGHYFDWGNWSEYRDGILEHMRQEGVPVVARNLGE